ncbi:MAG: HypC/HybG/HupF family hydrogenase formation chaperone [Alphaproteobacteria bacterium]|nr:HypC/HybG/HupF family hydrogenase formation chaperone [Alphaproteobacteria bacterium]
MCLAIPSKVLEVDGTTALVERYGERLTVSLTMLPEPVAVGDYVIVQARRHAVQTVDAAAAAEAFRLFDELSEILAPALDGGASATKRRTA